MAMRERIASGKLFTDYCEGLPEDRVNGKKRMIALNNTLPEDTAGRMAEMKELFGKETDVWIEPPFYCCYGYNITIGEGSCVNFNCNFVDDGKITIGRKVMFGPAVTIATVGYPINPDMREYMYSLHGTVGDNCWIVAGVTICPGVTIGENMVIGAGSVVVNDISANCVAVGNSYRVVREIGEQDKMYYYKDRKIAAEDLGEERKLRQGCKIQGRKENGNFIYRGGVWLVFRIVYCGDGYA